MFVYDRNCGFAVGPLSGGDDSVAARPLLAM
jgi:hypothetical protein